MKPIVIFFLVLCTNLSIAQRFCEYTTQSYGVIDSTADIIWYYSRSPIYVKYNLNGVIIVQGNMAKEERINLVQDSIREVYTEGPVQKVVYNEYNPYFVMYDMYDFCACLFISNKDMMYILMNPNLPRQWRYYQKMAKKY
jgi:hypothetical protein